VRHDHVVTIDDEPAQLSAHPAHPCPLFFERTAAAGRIDRIASECNYQKIVHRLLVPPIELGHILYARPKRSATVVIYSAAFFRPAAATANSCRRLSPRRSNGWGYGIVRHFLSQDDLEPAEILTLFARASDLKRARYSGELAGRSLVMFFEKASTRTRLSFEIGISELGGHAIYLDRDSSQLSRGESLRDTAAVVSRYADLMMARVYAHDTLAQLAANASIPVINGLSDDEHPCQSLADLFTILECKGRIEGIHIAYVGDGDNNVTHSLMLGTTQLGGHITVASPSSLQPQKHYFDRAQANCESYGGSVSVTDDPQQAVRGADVIYADAWVSMGREADREERLALLRPYQVNEELLRLAAPDHIFMHCLPAHIDEEVTADVAYGSHSVIFEEAENRLHVQKALMLFLFHASQGEQ
jgi:ornithine carbamoyltransferase